MKLFITDHADPSVGMFPCTWEVEVPFLMSDSEIKEYKVGNGHEWDYFKNDIEELFASYCDGRCEAYYEFETKNN
jgi:hypothetical protein